MFKNHRRRKAAREARRARSTRQHVLDTALALFRRQGFARTTMRDIADAAGLSLGAAYHYFPSKDALVMAYYEWMQAEHERLVDDQRGRRTLTSNRGSPHSSRPSSSCSAAIERSSARSSGISAIRPIRCQCSAARRRASASAASASSRRSSRTLLYPTNCGRLLGRLLWLTHLGIVLFFIHDTSPKQARTSKLVEALVDFAASAVPFISHPFAAPVRRRMLDLMSYLDGEREVTA